MLAKITSNNQITLPTAIASQFDKGQYFDVSVEAGRIVLTPARPPRADAVRAKLAALGAGEGDVAAAIAWVRRK